MSEELQQALAALISKLTQGVSDGALFAQEQLPDVLEQLLRYKMVLGDLCQMDLKIFC